MRVGYVPGEVCGVCYLSCSMHQFVEKMKQLRESGSHLGEGGQDIKETLQVW